MASSTQPSQQQGSEQKPVPQPQQGQSGTTTPQQGAKPIFNDWASI